MVLYFTKWGTYHFFVPEETNDTPITPQQQDHIHDLKQFLVKDGILHVPYDKLGELKHPDVLILKLQI